MDSISFFRREEIAFFRQYARTTYSPLDQLGVSVGARLKREIFAKTNFWASALKIEGFEVREDNYWQRRGIFASYSWARIYRTGDRGRKVFFTVGVDAEGQALIYKLDRYFSSSVKGNSLTPSQDLIFKRVVQDTNACRQAIFLDDLRLYGWERLIELTRDFIRYYSLLYDEAIFAIWNEFVHEENTLGSLRQRPVPGGIVNLPVRVPIQSGINVDYDSENALKKELGDRGERLVILEEKRLLTESGRVDLVDKVQKVMDWNGFDILSFKSDGSPKFIEVKTTTGTATFDWTYS